MNLDLVASHFYHKEYADRFLQPDFDFFYCTECGAIVRDSDLQELGLCEECVKKQEVG